MSDHYNTLGVQRGATGDDIKKAYRKLAMKYHPDKNPGDKQAEDKFKKASEAYSVLGDPERKRSYDQFGAAGVNMGAGFKGQNPFEGFGGFSQQGRATRTWRTKSDAPSCDGDPDAGR